MKQMCAVCVVCSGSLQVYSVSTGR